MLSPHIQWIPIIRVDKFVRRWDSRPSSGIQLYGALFRHGVRCALAVAVAGLIVVGHEKNIEKTKLSQVRLPQPVLREVLNILLNGSPKSLSTDSFGGMAMASFAVMICLSCPRAGSFLHTRHIHAIYCIYIIIQQINAS